MFENSVTFPPPEQNLSKTLIFQSSLKYISNITFTFGEIMFTLGEIRFTLGDSRRS